MFGQCASRNAFYPPVNNTLHISLVTPPSSEGSFPSSYVFAYSGFRFSLSLWKQIWIWQLSHTTHRCLPAWGSLVDSICLEPMPDTWRDPILFTSFCVSAIVCSQIMHFCHTRQFSTPTVHPSSSPALVWILLPTIHKMWCPQFSKSHTHTLPYPTIPNLQFMENSCVSGHFTHSSYSHWPAIASLPVVTAMLSLFASWCPVQRA